MIFEKHTWTINFWPLESFLGVLWPSKHDFWRVNEKMNFRLLDSFLSVLWSSKHDFGRDHFFRLFENHPKGFYTGNAPEVQFWGQKINFSSSAQKWHSNPFRSETTLPNCIFLFIMVGTKGWLILKKSSFSIFWEPS